MATRPMDKDELLETIRTKHGQLERYLFYFEKNAEGVFVAGDRPRFGMEEMVQSQLVGDWSLKDLLSHLVDWERRFLHWYQACLEGETPGDLPPPDLRWDRIDTGDFRIPMDIGRRSARQYWATSKNRTAASFPPWLPFLKKRWSPRLLCLDRGRFRRRLRRPVHVSPL